MRSSHTSTAPVGSIGVRRTRRGNVANGMTVFRMPSMTPISSLLLAIPIAGGLIVLFTMEQLVNGLVHGFGPELEKSPSLDDPEISGKQESHTVSGVGPTLSYVDGQRS